jgi:hypothetical protein
MRHHDIRLTMETYTDPRLLDEREALEALPDLPIEIASKPTIGRVGKGQKLA